ncbi:MAG: hypothetical protein WA871_13345, partial [Candidatus Acidiferrales bacterium]
MVYFLSASLTKKASVWKFIKSFCVTIFGARGGFDFSALPFGVAGFFCVVPCDGDFVALLFVLSDMGVDPSFVGRGSERFEPFRVPLEKKSVLQIAFCLVLREQLYEPSHAEIAARLLARKNVLDATLLCQFVDEFVGQLRGMAIAQLARSDFA